MKYFLPKKIGRHFELESTLRIGSVHNTGYYWAYDSYESYDYDHTSTNLSLYINARYNFKIGKHFEIFPQQGTSFVKSFTSTSKVIYETGKPTQYTTNKGNYRIDPFKNISPAIGAT